MKGGLAQINTDRLNLHGDLPFGLGSLQRRTISLSPFRSLTGVQANKRRKLVRRPGCVNHRDTSSDEKGFCLLLQLRVLRLRLLQDGDVRGGVFPWGRFNTRIN